jgi:hypothetical protein
MKTPSRKCPQCGIEMEPCDHSPLYGYSWVHPPETESNKCVYAGELMFGGYDTLWKELEKTNATQEEEE